MSGNSIVAGLPAEKLQALAHRFAQLDAPARWRLLGKLAEENIDFALLPIPALAATESLASYAQRRLWFLWQIDPHGCAYNLPAALRLRGALDKGALQRSFDDLVARHAALRTVFRHEHEQVLQIVVPSAPAIVGEDDLSALPADGRLPRALAIAADEARQPFDLGHGPLFRVRLLRLAPDDHVLLLTLHHIVADGWSMDILVREFATFYGAHRLQRQPALRELSIAYTDFATWQRNWLEAGELQRQLAYWTQQLGDADTVLNLPTDNVRPAMQSYRGAYAEFEVDAELASHLEAVAQQHGATLSMVLLAAFNVLLYRYSGQTDLRVGVPIANRHRGETEGLLGFFVNTQVLRCQLHGPMSFADVLACVREASLGAQAHQDLPFERLVEAINPARSLSHNPLFQVKYNFQRWTHDALQELPGLQAEILQGEQVGTHFDISLDFTRHPSWLRGRFVYASDLFAAESMARMAMHLQALLLQVAADPGQRIDALVLPNAAEHGQLQRWRSESQVFAATDVVQLFRAAASVAPDRIALRAAQQVLTFAALDAKSNRVARYLQAAGVGLETRVGLLAGRSIAAVVALLGILKAGAAYVPLDPKFPAARIRDIAIDCDLAMIFSEAGSPLFDELPPTLLRPLDASTFAAFASSPPAASILPEQAAYTIYTSGSTGRPKGVTIPHGALANYVQGVLQRLALPAGGSMGMVSTLAADLGHTVLFGALCSGRTLHLIDADCCADPDRFADYMATHGVDTLKIVPSHLQALLQAAQPRAVLPRHTLILGGDITPWPLVQTIQSLRPDCRVVNHYGPTEATVGALAGPIEIRSDCASAPLGTPFGNACVSVLDEALQSQPVGVYGEIYIGGAGLARGYHRQPALTAERFVPDAAGAPGARLYRTGDRGRYRSDGCIEFLGRVDHQVKIRGYRVEPDEVARVLRELDGIAAATVVAQAAATGTRLIAYYVLKSQTTPDAAQIRVALQQQLPDYLVPAVFMALPALPLTANGKIDRGALPPVDQQPAAPAAVAPRNATEQVLTGIWSEVLKRPDIGVEDNFFELGGDSILSLQIIARARKLGIVITPRQLFEKQTIADLAAVARLPATEAAVNGPAVQPQRSAEVLTAAQWAKLPVARSAVDAVYALTPMQQGLLFHSLIAPDSGVHINQRICSWEGALDIERFCATWRECLALHPILRTLFVWEGSAAPLQVVCRDASLPFELLDWRDGTEQTLADFVRRDRLRGFDCGKAPLLRITLIRLADRRYHLVWTVHHLLLDGWSSARVLYQVFAAYAATQRGDVVALPTPTPFADYVAWLQRQDLTRAETFWRDSLRGLAAPTLLAKHVFPAQREEGHGSLITHLPDALFEGLKKFAQAQRVTVGTVLQGAVALLLGLYTSTRDVVLGATVSGRSAAVPGIQDMVGLLINTLPLRVRLDSHRTVGAWLRDIQAANIALRDYEFAPLAEVQRWSELARGTPLFDTLLVIQNYPVAPALWETVGSLGMDEFQSFEQTHYPLAVLAVPREDALRVRFDFDRAHFDEALVATLSRQLQNLLRSCIADAEASLQTVSALDVQERAELVSGWQGPRRTTGDFRCPSALFTAQAERTPDAVALVTDGSALTYRELSARVDRLACQLRQLGVGADVLVGVCVTRTPALPISLLAVLKAGGAYVPLDPEYPAERLAHMIQDARPALVLCEQSTLAALDAVSSGTRLWCFEHDAGEPDAAESALDGRDSGSGAPAPAVPDHLAYCIYTSGSTGRPKGVAVSRGALHNFLCSMREAPGLDATDTVLALTSVNFDIAALEFYLPLVTGARIALVPRSLATNPEALLAFVQRHQVSVVQATPSAWRLLSEHADFGAMRLRLALCGGEALPGDLADRLTDCAEAAWNLYGPTETTVWSARQPLSGGAMPLLGLPLHNTTLHVLSDHLDPQPCGAMGELYIGGEGLARGYWQRAALSAERFVPDPFAADGARLYRTGDLAVRHANGRLQYLGRADQQVKIRGIRIEPGEIEALLQQHAAVHAAAVMVRDVGTGPQLTGYVVAPASVSGAELQRHLARHLPDYMVPAQIVRLEALPVTPAGKLDRQALPDPARQLRAHVEPRDALEADLAAIWRQVLRVPQVGLTDNFFELGGHSLLAAQATAHIRHALAPDIPFDLIFEAATLEVLAQRLRELPKPVGDAIAAMDELLSALE